MGDPVEIEAMERLSEEMRPYIEKWNDNYGTVNLIRVICCYVSEFIDDQPIPEAALMDFIKMLKAVHQGRVIAR